MKIIDAFTFFNEVDLLKIRLELLYPQVDRFLICESNLTHSGHEKKYNYLIHEKEFEKWKDKITYIQFEQEIKNFDFSTKDTEYNPDSAAWKIENGQRNFLATALKNYAPDDLAIISDVDEIWNPSLAQFLRDGRVPYECARLEMHLNYYYLNCCGVGVSNSKWFHAYFASVSLINDGLDLSHARTSKAMKSVGNAGWHFSYLGGAKKISEKINATAHQETNTPEINNLEHLQRCITLGIDHLNRAGHELAFHPVEYYPVPLANLMRCNPHLVKTSLL